MELAINRYEWQDERRQFTPTCHVDDKVLEFTIKGYPAQQRMTRELHSLSPGAELLMSEPFGTISYQSPGAFLAGGAGITPFIAILRERVRAGDIDRHALIFSNKTPADVICEKELRHYLGERCILTCTDAEVRVTRIAGSTRRFSRTRSTISLSTSMCAARQDSWRR